MKNHAGTILWRTALDAVFPRRCPVCDRAVRPFGRLICRECEEDLFPRMLSEQDALCCCCGRPLADPRAEFCRGCEGVTHACRRGGAAYRYRDVSGALYRLKYEGRAEYADWMGEQMADCLLRNFAGERIDALTPVPVSKERARRRGYNQASLLARRISAITGIPVHEEYLIRREDTAVLREMGALDRRSKIKNAFIAPIDDVKSKIIVLIDDIYTTGATVDACAAQLLQRGAGTVYYVAFAVGEDLQTE